MPQLRIPSEYKSGMVKLQSLSPSAVDELIGVLRSAPVKFYRRDLTDAIKGRIASIPDDDLSAIVDVLASLEYVRATADRPLDAFMQDLTEALRRASLPIENADGTSTVDRIKQLLQAPSLGIPAKARTLLLEGRTLCRARVVTDIRPVFDAAEVPSRPQAALVVHNLRISYHDGSRAVQDFIVSLDSNDLDELIEVLNRAKLKEQILAGILDVAKTPYLKIE